MANRRMLSKTISTSIQVNRLCLPARLLFTWMIPHADDEGKMKGDPSYIKAVVVPLTNWTHKKVKSYLENMRDAELIYYWQQNNELFIEFIKWKDYQQLRKDRFHISKLPSFNVTNDNQMSTSSQPNDNQPQPEDSLNEDKKDKDNKSESSEVIADEIAGNNLPLLIDPGNFVPTNAGETAALEAFIAIEPENRLAFTTTYLWAYKKGLPTDLFYRYTSEIEQDKNIKNKGAVFRSKVESYFQK